MQLDIGTRNVKPTYRAVYTLIWKWKVTLYKRESLGFLLVLIEIRHYFLIFFFSLEHVKLKSIKVINLLYKPRGKIFIFFMSLVKLNHCYFQFGHHSSKMAASLWHVYYDVFEKIEFLIFYRATLLFGASGIQKNNVYKIVSLLMHI